MDVANRRCEQLGCQKAPLFNYPGQLRRLFCADHKAEGMVNLRLHKAAEQNIAAVAQQHAMTAAARQGGLTEEQVAAFAATVPGGMQGLHQVAAMPGLQQVGLRPV